MMDALQKSYASYQQALYHTTAPKVRGGAAAASTRCALTRARPDGCGVRWRQDPYLWYGIGLLYERHYSLEQVRARVVSLLLRARPGPARAPLRNRFVRPPQAEEAFMAVLVAAPAFEHAAEVRAGPHTHTGVTRN